MDIALRLNTGTDVVDGIGRPVSMNHTVDTVGAWLAAHDAALPLYLEAHFKVVAEAPVSIEKQIAAKTRRLKAIAAKCGRAVVRVEQTNGCLYRALLAR